MKTETLNWISAFFRYALLACAILYIAAYLILVFFRIQYPFELEWMESGSVGHVIRILSGQKLYVSPSLEFVPFVYTPLYFYISAFISKIIGVGFMPLRLVSFISSLGCFFIIFIIVKRETESNFLGILASALFSATFRISGAWFDIARADSLFLFLLLTALYLIKFKESSKSYALAGVFISLSFLTKQTALIIAMPIMLYCIFANWRRSIFFIGTICIIVGGSTLILNHIHHGWYNYYVFELPSQHPIDSKMYVQFWTKNIISPLLIAFSASMFYVFSQFLKSNKKNCLFYFLITVGMLGASWISILHIRGYPNGLFPACAIISILFALEIHTISEFLQSIPTETQKLMEIRLYLICIIQFLVLLYNPLRQIPTQKDLKAGREFVNTVRQVQGDVFIPQHSYLSVLAGKNNHAHAAAIVELFFDSKAGKNEKGKKVIRELWQAIREKRFGAIVDGLSMHYPPRDIEKYYIRQELLFENENVFRPVTGYRIRPRFIYVPKNNAAD